MQGEEHNDIASLQLIMRRIELACSSIQVDATAQSQVKTTLAKLEEQMNSVELKLDRVLHLLENSTEPNSGHVGDIGESPMKGKRSAENEIEKAVSAKKQKVARGETVVPDDSDLDSHPKDKSVVKEQPVTVTVSKKTIIADSSSESDTDDDGIDVDMVDADKSASLTFQKTEEEKEAAVQPRKAQRRPTQSKAPKDSSSSEECDECDSDEEEEEKKKAVTHPKNAQEKPTQSNTPNHSSSSEESDSDEEPQTTPSPKAKESKTLFVENLSFDVKESQVREFFKNAVDVRLSTVAGMCKGFGHVEFATAEAAKQAMKLNTQPLLGRRVRLKLAS